MYNCIIIFNFLYNYIQLYIFFIYIFYLYNIHIIFIIISHLVHLVIKNKALDRGRPSKWIRHTIRTPRPQKTLEKPDNETLVSVM